MSVNSTQSAHPPSLLNVNTIGFDGISVACILYGVYIVITGANLSPLTKKRYRALLTYTIVQLVITTLYFAILLYAASAKNPTIFSIVGSYSSEPLSTWPMVIVNAAFVLNTWASDGFLLYRCYIICMANKYALAVPIILYLATLGASLAWLIVSSSPGAACSSHAVQVAGLCYWSCSAAMNVCASCLISARFWMRKLELTRATGLKKGTFYLEYIAMTLESAALYTVFVVVMLVVFVLNSPLENVFFPVLGAMQAIAPSLIIYRIGHGIALQTDERGTLIMSDLRFSEAGQPQLATLSLHEDSVDNPGAMDAPSGESNDMNQGGGAEQPAMPHSASAEPEQESGVGRVSSGDTGAV